ncbi:isochorismate synthase [Staphylococcus sp. 17KM0847]|uniref:isochorismate synthase n=1 Tax=Staphylococcus sp. 17KM0847 TaxID=2583989 RepID=UPI0015DCA6C0|nr:isochorismate synthase [Staphylococcus sp. 17KM0847]QLK85683.1 isochorismate synthase [Staphylococcus sp. 17KM0847]
MTVDAREQAIIEAVKQANQQWVSVEVKLSQTMDPITLFNATEEASGNRFYFRLNNNDTAFFGYRSAAQIKNDSPNRHSVFEAWQKIKSDITYIHPDSDQHHLRICGGFQFSTQRTGEAWQTFGMNHFIVPEVLITQDDNSAYLTYTVQRAAFSIDDFHALVTYFEDLKYLPADLKSIPEVKYIEDVHREAWQKLVDDTVTQLGVDEKIVLSRQRHIVFEKNIPISTVLYQALQNEKNSYLFVLESEKATFVSQTPEQLFRVADGKLFTKAVAGTIRRTHDEQQDTEQLARFLKDRKNLGEHQIVVDSILEDIRPFVTEVHYDLTPNILKNDHLYHLYTEIGGSLAMHSYMGLIDVLHPTPALGGYPKAMAQQYIDAHEFNARGLYGAPVGMIDIDDNCEFVVAIRSMLINQNQATLFAGAGIVKDSDPVSEVEETALKFSPMMDALGVKKVD